VRVLVAEDDPGLRDVLVRGLESSGYVVDSVARGDDAVFQMKLYDYDVAIIDWRMPGGEGIEVVRWARKNEKPTGLLMLTARDAPPDRIQGLDAGADDYVVKPFDFGELLARVRALQRRPRAVDGAEISRGNLVLDPVKREITLNSRPVHLSQREYSILELLIRRSPALVDRTTIAQHAWPDETDAMGSNVIDVHMSRLRAKLPGSRVQIVTVRGAGYRMEER